MPTSPVTHETPWRDEAQRTAREAYQRRKQYELEARETLHARWGKALGWGPEKIREKVSSDPVVITLRGLVKNLKQEIRDRDKVTKEAREAIEGAYEAAHAPMLEKQKAEFAAEYADYYKALYGDTSKEYEKSLKQQLKVLKDYYTARHALYMKEIPGTKKWGERGIEVMKIAEEGAEIKKALQDIYEKRVKIQEDAAKKLLAAQKKAYDSEIDALKEHLDKMNWLISTAGKMYDLTGNVDYLKNQLAVAKKLRADARSVMGEIPKRSATAENRMWKSITAMQERYEQARRKGAPEEAKNISAEIENAYTEISNIRKEGSKAWRAAVDQFFDAQSTINKITAEIGAVIPLENIEQVLDDARANLGLVKEASDSMGAVRAATMGVISAEQEKLKVLEASVVAYEKLNDVVKAAKMRTEIIKTKTEILALQKSMRGNLEDEFKKLAQMVINAPANLEKILATSGISYWNKWFQAKRNALLGMQPAYAGIGGQGAQNINFRFYFDGEEVFPTKRVQEIADGRIRQNQRQ